MMDIEAFRKIDAHLRAERPKAFLLSPPDPPATSEALVEVERRLGIALPKSYRDFLSEFGGGDFGLTNICSAERESDFYLPKVQHEMAAYAVTELLVFSSDYTGGFYVLRVVDGIAEESVLYWHIDDELKRTPFANVLEFVERHAYHSN